MKQLILCGIAATTLGACSGGGSQEKIYDMPPEDARRILLSTDFERGILPGSSSLKPEVWTNNEGVPEWRVLNEEKKSGWWCALSIEPADGDATKTRVVNKCEGAMTAGNNRKLDELVDAALTDRAPKFD